MTPAFSYLRTSSSANVDGDSPFRQDKAVMTYAKAQGIAVRACFWGAAVKGADPIETRRGFAALLEAAQAEDVTLVLVEDPTRFARSIIAQELGVMLLASKSIRVVTASGQDLTDNTDPAKVMMRQIAGAFSQYEKAKLVEKLKAGRDRVREQVGKCGGRKSHAEVTPEVVVTAKRLARKNPKTGRTRSLRKIAAELAVLGHVNRNGQPYNPKSIAAMLGQKV
jgi:DNA invertase Pin-like site-specific DNA recombinase